MSDVNENKDAISSRYFDNENIESQNNITGKY